MLNSQHLVVLGQFSIKKINAVETFNDEDFDLLKSKPQPNL